MLIRTLSSGSGGNCTAVVGGGSALLVDAGVSMRRILGGLRECGIDPGTLTAILVTHCHIDHIAGLGTFAKRFSLPVLGTEGTCVKILEKFPDLKGQVFRFDYGSWGTSPPSAPPPSTTPPRASASGWRRRAAPPWWPRTWAG